MKYYNVASRGRGVLRFITYAKLITDKETVVKKWKLGSSIIGSWKGPNPRGTVLTRSGILNMYTGAYYLLKPLTTMFGNFQLFNVRTGQLFTPSWNTLVEWNKKNRPWLIAPPVAAKTIYK